VASFALWIGAIFCFLFVFAPAVKGLPSATAIPLLNQGRRNFQAFSWLIITLLVLTGIANLVFSGKAAGIAPGSTYTMILGLKLFLFLAMVLHHSIQAFKYAPRIESLTALVPPGSENWPDTLLAQWNRWFILLKINGTLGPLILLVAVGLKGF
jgi:uncharacterized membrane protein